MGCFMPLKTNLPVPVMLVTKVHLFAQTCSVCMCVYEVGYIHILHVLATMVCSFDNVVVRGLCS